MPVAVLAAANFHMTLQRFPGNRRLIVTRGIPGTGYAIALMAGLAPREKRPVALFVKSKPPPEIGWGILI